MANDFLGGLGGLMKGLSGLMPQDDPKVKVMQAQTEMSDLAAQENELYAQIGKKAVQMDGLERFGELADRLKLVQSNLTLAANKLKTVQEEKEAAERQEQEAAAQNTCAECGAVNPEGVKFCQECGAKMRMANQALCNQCGEKNPPGTRFCGSCGAKLGE